MVKKNKNEGKVLIIMNNITQLTHLPNQSNLFDNLSKSMTPGITLNQSLTFSSRKSHSFRPPLTKKIMNAKYVNNQIRQNSIEPSLRDIIDCGPEYCAICQFKYKNNDRLIELKCKHEFHDICLTKWFNKQQYCPICKEIVYYKKDVGLFNIWTFILDPIMKDIGIHFFVSAMSCLLAITIQHHKSTQYIT